MQGSTPQRGARAQEGDEGNPELAAGEALEGDGAAGRGQRGRINHPLEVVQPLRAPWNRQRPVTMRSPALCANVDRQIWVDTFLDTIQSSIWRGLPRQIVMLSQTWYG